MRHLARFSLMVALVSYQTIRLHAAGKQDIELSNAYLQLVFNGGTGELAKMEYLKEPQGTIVNAKPMLGSPWEIVMGNDEQNVHLQAGDARSFTYTKSHGQLELTWRAFENLPKAFAVIVAVELLPDSAMSSWHIRVEGTKGVLLSQVTFPRIAGIQDLGKEELAVPDWMGSLLQSPRAELLKLKPGARQFSWSYPGFMSMQFITLYNPERFGVYFACNDSASFNKQTFMSMDDHEQLVYGVENFPSYDEKETAYQPPYAFLIGAFKGDWFTAAQLYKQWAVQQPWCRDSRLANKKVPEWLENTGYWVWNRGRAANVLPPATALAKKMGVPVSVLWHWWHGGPYDDSFPEFFPPRDGKQAFLDAMQTAQAQGTKALVYMNTLAWGTSTKSWDRLGAERYAAKDIHGKIYSHVYNIFTKKALANMCDGTDFWRNYYASLADTAINQYGVDGIYMDQACINMHCYDPSHGHTIGGGNYWVKGFAEKDRLIRKTFPKGGQQVLAGEGGSENWLPYLDVFLTLPVSKERYAGVHGWQTIPLFQTVYHEYGITFGNYSSLLSPPYDELWPKEFAPEDAETPLDTAFNRQFLMEQARSLVWGMQPMISNYQPFLDTIRATEMDYVTRLAKVRQSGLKYFMYGECMRSPLLDIPEQEMPISKLSIYAGRNEQVTRFEKAFPQLYAGAWKAQDSHLAIALASISDQDYPVDFTLNTAEYGIGGAGEVLLHDENGVRKLGDYSGQSSHVVFTLPKRGICFVELIPAL